MRTPILAIPLLLAACDGGANEPGPGGVTQSEARELNEAAEMLDANAVALGAVTDQEGER